MLWVFWGYLNGNPGVNDYFRVQVIWPLIYFILITIINSKNIIYRIFQLMVIFTFIISFYNVYQTLAVFNIVPNIFKLTDIFVIGTHPGYTQLATLNIGSLVFLIPFVIVGIISDTDFLKKIKISRTFLLLTTLVSILCGIISGRRVILILIILNAAIVFLLPIFSKDYKIKYYSHLPKIVLVFGCIAILTVIIGNKIDINYTTIKYRLIEELDPINDTPRKIQMAALINEFYHHPIIGTGFGIGVDAIIRNIERPWIYELTYILYLYNTGIIGMILYLYILIFPIIWGIQLFKKDSSLKNIIFPIMAGYISVLIASATNPYIGSSFDFLWMLFLPVGIFNYLQKAQVKKLECFSRTE
jgi:hypothetical protein